MANIKHVDNPNERGTVAIGKEAYSIVRDAADSDKRTIKAQLEVIIAEWKEFRNQSSKGQRERAVAR